MDKIWIVTEPDVVILSAHRTEEGAKSESLSRHYSESRQDTVVQEIEVEE